jgi:hypothetical protein
VSPAEQAVNGIAQIIERTAPFYLTLRGNNYRAAITNQQGGVYNLAQVTAGLAKNETLYILLAGARDIREYDQFEAYGKHFQIGMPSNTFLFGEPIQTQAGITEVAGAD